VCDSSSNSPSAQPQGATIAQTLMDQVEAPKLCRVLDPTHLHAVDDDTR
jgi:hypothetical protein